MDKIESFAAFGKDYYITYSFLWTDHFWNIFLRGVSTNFLRGILIWLVRMFYGSHFGCSLHDHSLCYFHYCTLQVDSKINSVQSRTSVWKFLNIQLVDVLCSVYSKMMTSFLDWYIHLTIRLRGFYFNCWHCRGLLILDRTDSAVSLRIFHYCYSFQRIAFIRRQGNTNRTLSGIDWTFSCFWCCNLQFVVEFRCRTYCSRLQFQYSSWFFEPLHAN